MSVIALPAIAADMKVSIVSITWVSNSYILGLTLIIPLSHWLSQRFWRESINGQPDVDI